MGKTLVDKIWDSHLVKSLDSNVDVLYIDRHLIHEVTSPQAFTKLNEKGLKVFRPQSTIATVDHNIPTLNQHLPIKDKLSRLQVETLKKNCAEHEIELYGIGHKNQGIVHVIGPELGITQPGLTMVCGDSHTSTHGAFGNIAFGIGTSQVAQVLATQTLLVSRPRTMRVNIDGTLKKGVSAKDLILFVISQLGTGGCTGHFLEYSGKVIRNLSMEERMTVCNMSIEMGARGGIIAPDEKVFEYLKDRMYAPKGDAWKKSLEEWINLKSDEDALFHKELTFNASLIEPMITYGTSPDTSISINSKIPVKNESNEKALNYMGFNGGEFIQGKKVDYVFIGSCTNSRIEDLRAAASIVEGKTKADEVEVWIVPGSQSVLRQAREEGIIDVFKRAGIEIREPGCSACLSMNEDKIPSGAICISTSNRNFEGRQGEGSRTLLASPISAAAAAITGVITDPRTILN